MWLLLSSHPVMSDSLWPHGLQHTMPLCLSPSPEACPSSCPFHQWSHPVISSSDAMNRLFASDDQTSGASASVLPVSIQGWFPLRLTDLISWLSEGFQGSSPAPQFEGINSSASAFFTVQLSQPYVTTGKTIALTIWTFVSRVMSLLFNTLSRFVIAFLPRSKRLLISWLQSPSAVILEPQKSSNLSLLLPFPPLFSMK